MYVQWQLIPWEWSAINYDIRVPESGWCVHICVSSFHTHLVNVVCDSWHVWLRGCLVPSATGSDQPYRIHSTKDYSILGGLIDLFTKRLLIMWQSIKSLSLIFCNFMSRGTRESSTAKFSDFESLEIELIESSTLRMDNLPFPHSRINDQLKLPMFS